MAKPQRPTWFRLFEHHKPLIDFMPSKAVGEALKAIMAYFVYATEPQLDDTAMMLFVAMKPDIDETYEDYFSRVKRGKESQKRKGEDSNTQQCLAEPTYTKAKTKTKSYLYTEANANTDADTDAQTQADTDQALAGLSEEEKRAYWLKVLSAPELHLKEGACSAKPNTAS